MAFVCLSASAEPPNLEDYRVKRGGLVVLPQDSWVEGSVKVGGLQPDYLIDYADPRLFDVLDYAREVGNRPRWGIWRKIREIQEYIRKRALPEGEYENRRYLSLMESFRRRGEPIRLGDYVECGAGVCRENGLLTHMALNAAGIANSYVYVRVNQYGHVEDHAFPVITVDGVQYAVDTYNSNFNGHEFSRLQEERVGWESMSPLNRQKLNAEVQVERVLKYPYYYVPQGAPRRGCPDIWRLIEKGAK